MRLLLPWLLLMVLSCRPSMPAQGPGEARAAAVRKPAAGGAPVRVSRLQVTYVLDAQGGFTRISKQRYEILTPEGVEGWGYSAVTWHPWFMAKPAIEATVTDAGGQLHPLDPATLSEGLADEVTPDKYGEHRVLRAPLPSVAVGAIVDETIRERSERPFFEGGMLHRLPLQYGVPMDSVELIVDAPEGLELEHVARDADVKIEEQTSGKRRRLIFKGGPYVALEPVEDYSPEDIAPWPYLAFAIKIDWATLAKDYAARLRERRDNARLPGVDVRRIVQGASTEQEKSNRLLEWLQGRVRYVALEFGTSHHHPGGAGRDAEARLRRLQRSQSILLLELLEEGRHRRSLGAAAHGAWRGRDRGNSCAERL